MSSPGSSVTAPKKPAPTPKTPFPDTHLPFLLDKITQLQASSLILLVEAIYHDLRGHKVTKISIEAKVKEVGEKCKEKKVWVVKPSILVGIADWTCLGCTLTSVLSLQATQVP